MYPERILSPSPRYFDESLVTDEKIEGYLKPMRAKDWDKASLLQFRSFDLSGGGPDLEQFPRPVLLVQGAEDRAVPAAQVRKVAAKLGDVATYVEFAQCGHLPMEEKAEDFLAAVVPWLEELGTWERGEVEAAADGGSEDEEVIVVS